MAERQKTNEKIRRAIVAVGFSLLWLIFGSSVSILSPTNGSLGALFGCLFSLAAILGPIYYVKLRNITIKNPKPLFVEPSIWVAFPLAILASGLLFLVYMLVLSVPAFGFLLDPPEKETFIGTAVMMTVIITSFGGPVTIYCVYILTHYKRIVGYNSAEWKKIKSDRKASRRG